MFNVAPSQKNTEWLLYFCFLYQPGDLSAIKKWEFIIVAGKLKVEAILPRN